MLTIGIRYLNGFAAATDPDDRDQAEWPPHPGRVFMALAAAHFQGEPTTAERTALEWLESQSPPQMHAPDAQARAVVTHFVPVNDSAGPSKAMLQSAPVTRDRQPRTFARAWLEKDIVWLAWPKAEPDPPIREALAALCGKVTRIGHSTSLVQMWLADMADSSPNWVPDDGRATKHLRVTTTGTLDELEKSFNREENEAYAALLVAAEDPDKRTSTAARKRLREEFPQEPTRRRPQLSIYRGYAPPLEEREEAFRCVGSCFSPHLLVFTLERADGPYRQLDLASVPSICQRWHEALCSQCEGLGETAASLVSGRAGGKPLDTPHLAFVPLAFVGQTHADGRLLGMGLALPEGIGHDERREVLQAIERVRRQDLRLGRLGRWRLGRVEAERPLLNLVPKTWTGHPDGAKEWATVTPIAFDHHAKAKEPSAYRSEVAGMIRQACGRIGLPEPREVIVTSVSAHLGAPPAHEFPRLLRKDGSQRRHMHAILLFAEEVRGPILLGAGRYRGYGVCRPLLGEP